MHKPHDMTLRTDLPQGGSGRRSREASWDRNRAASGDRNRGSSSGSRPSREMNRRATPYGSRDSSQGRNHSLHHLVHYTGVDVDSSDEEEDEVDEDIEESVSFEDMLEQARNQSDTYSAEEDSDEDISEPYVIHPYYTKYVTKHVSVATAETGQPKQPGAGSVDSCVSSASGMCVARNTRNPAACDAAIAAATAAPAGGYPTQPHQPPEASQKGHHYFKISRWKSLSQEEKVKKKEGWQNRTKIIRQFEISPFTTPPRTDLDVSLESDNNEED